MAVLAVSVASAVFLAASPAAATGPGQPRVDQPPAGTVGQPVTFHVTPPLTGEVPSGYLYQLNSGPPGSITATAGEATIVVTATRLVNTLTVTSLSANGEIGDSLMVVFDAAPAPPAPDADLTGDGIADLVVVGSATNGLPPGLWQAPGTTSGVVSTAAMDIGANGNGLNYDGTPADFLGAQVITGHFSGGGEQDVLIYYPDGSPSGADPGSGAVLITNGDGSIIQAQYSGYHRAIYAGQLADGNGNNPLQLANAGTSVTTNPLFSDLIAINGDATHGYGLDYYLSKNTTGSYRRPVLLTNPTPTGGTDWNTWKIATTQIAGTTAMFLYQPATGGLYLWRDVTFDQGTRVLSYTPATLATDWNTGATLDLRAADINNDATPDLWTVAAGGTVTAWLTTDLATTPTITAQPAQTLVTAQPT